MTIRSYGIAIAMTLVMLGSPAYGQSPSCYDDMVVPGRCLPWGFNNLAPQLAPGGFLPTDLSRDGTTLSGHDTAGTVFRWNLETTGAQTLSLGGDQFVQAVLPVMSDDGSIVAGTTILNNASSIFRWDALTPDITILPNGPANGIDIVYTSETNGTVVPYDFASISGDGNTITGIGAAFNGSDELVEDVWIFRWTQSGGTNDDPQLDFSTAVTPWTVAGNGSDIVGFLDDPFVTGDNEAMTWSPGSGVSLGTGSMTSRATAVSYDGQVIAGQRTDNGANSRFFRWTQATGAVDIQERFQPRTVSDDGELIAGADLNIASPYTWTVASGYESLVDYLVDFGVFFPIPSAASNPLAIASGDGSVFVVVGERWVANVRPLSAVALGDSYSSGEGAPDDNDSYIPPTGNQNSDGNECHRSVKAYPALIGPRSSTNSFRENESVSPSTGFEWDFIACSGAKSVHIRRAPGGQYYTEPHQLDQNLLDADTDLVTITIGGNDAYFEAVLTGCANPFYINCKGLSSPDAGKTWEEFLPQHLHTTVRQNVRAIYDDIKLEAPNATIIALGYPFLLAGNSCAEALPISVDEQNWIRGLSVLMNRVLSQEANAAGIHFVSVADRFETVVNGQTVSHDVCGNGEDWINGIRFPKVHSFHPNEIGHMKGYAEAVKQFLEGIDVANPERGFFESGMPRNPS